MLSREPRFELAGGQRLPLGGLNGYAGVRGKQGRKKDKFQGATPRKKHRTRLFDTAQEAARLRSRSSARTSSSACWRSGRPKRRRRLPAATPPRRWRWASSSATC